MALATTSVETTAEPAGWTRRLRAPTAGWVWGVLAVGVPTAATWFGRTMAIDLAYQVRAGEVMLDTHHLMNRDAFTFTDAGVPWLNQQWGAEVAFAGLWRHGGWGTVACAWGIAVGLIALLLFRTCRQERASARNAAVLTIAGYLVAVQILTMRPQLLGVLLFVATQWILSTRHRAPRRLWLIPPLVLVWVQVHGSFPLALVLLAFAWLEDGRRDPAGARRLLEVAAVSAIATVIDPWGLRSWTYIWGIAGSSVVTGRIAEWGPPSIKEPTGAMFFASLLGVLVVLARRRDPVPWVTLLRLGVFALLALFAIRGVVWWAMTFPVALAPSLGGAPASERERSPVHAVAIGLVAVLLLVALPFGRGADPLTGEPGTLTFAPEGLVDAARAAVPPGTRVFVSEVYGSWAEFAAPDLPVFVDPRIEIFPDAVWDDYFVVTDGRDGWQAVLRRWNVDALILDPVRAAGLLGVIGRDPGWKLVATNPDGSVFVRTPLSR